MLRSAVVGLLLGTTLLTGCSARTEANDSLPSTSSAPTTEALPPVGPADFPVPEEARTKDAAGAEAFLRYFLDLLDHQRAIPDGKPIRDLGPECQDCLRIAQNYDEAAAEGIRYVGGELTLNESTPPLLEGDTALISFAARQEAVQRVDPSGAPLDDGQDLAPRLSSGILLAYSDQMKSWLVKEFTLG
jgi:hypothetical protein